MDIVQSLRSFDPQGLSSDQLQQTVDLLAIAALKAKAAAQLQPAFVAESVEFQGFGRLTLQRLESTLKYVFLMPDSLATDRVQVLRELDVTSFIVCGLCLSKKALVRLDKALFEEVVRQARGSSHRLVNTIVGSNEVAEVVRKSGAETFKRNLDQLLELRIGAQSPEASLSMAGLPSWCYSVPSRRTSKFGRLVASTIGGAVSTYIPIRPESADCLIRVVMNFNEKLLKTLFGMEYKEYNAELHQIHSAFKGQIAATFGDDVCQAIQTSRRWAHDNNETSTTCVNADVYAGHCIIVGLTVGRKECVNFVNIAYGL